MKQFHVRSEAGELGEKLAKRFVEAKGHKVLACNYYHDKGKRSGEIDIITIFHGNLHFIEVKTRLIQESTQKSRALYFPLESQVTPLKIRKCQKTAEHNLRTTDQQDTENHFDLVTVLYITSEGKAEIQYLSDIYY